MFVPGIWKQFSAELLQAFQNKNSILGLMNRFYG
jgi:hypothetical protein